MTALEPRHAAPQLDAPAQLAACKQIGAAGAYRDVVEIAVCPANRVPETPAAVQQGRERTRRLALAVAATGEVIRR